MARLILIADDSPIIQRKAQRILQDEGFEVQTVSNGVAAVKKLPVMQPALVLADVSMPGKDGYEVCEFVKTSAGLRHVPVLLVGSDLEPYDEQRGARVRADGIIKKPFTPHDLIDIVRRLTALVVAPASEPIPEETPFAVQVAPTQLADDIMSLVAQQPHEHPLDTTGIMPEPCTPPSEPFPSFVLDPAAESGSQSSHEDNSEPKLAWETEVPRSAETAEFALPPQLVDLTAPEDVPGPIPALAESLPDPLSVVGPEPELVAAETDRGVEESKAQQVGELSLSPRLVDLTALDAAMSIGDPAPEPLPVVLPEAVATGPEKVRESLDLVPSAQPLESTSQAAAPEPASAGPETGQEWGDLISNPAALEAPAAPDVEWVYKVVQKVVARMAPPVLSPEQVEELALLLTREIASEIGGSCGQIVCPSERPSPA